VIDKRFEKALKVLELTPFVTYDEIKNKYRELSKNLHPDFGGSGEDMDRLNRAYELLKEYIKNYRYTFSDDEIKKQHLGSDYADKFRF